MLKTRNLLFGIVLVVVIFTGAVAINAAGMFGNSVAAGEIEEAIAFYNLSLWLCWVVLVTIAVYRKWTFKKDDIFYLLYVYLLAGFGFFGFLTQKFVNVFEINSGFEDNYTLGVFTALQYVIVTAALTGFLQAAVWWFTRRWHRR